MDFDYTSDLNLIVKSDNPQMTVSIPCHVNLLTQISKTIKSKLEQTSIKTPAKKKRRSSVRREALVETSNSNSIKSTTITFNEQVEIQDPNSVNTKANQEIKTEICTTKPRFSTDTYRVSFVYHLYAYVFFLNYSFLNSLKVD